MHTVVKSPSPVPVASKQHVVDLSGYVIIVVETKDKKVKLYGSPSDRDNLEVADEILDVNETKLEDATRDEVIQHIHECIQSCIIKLRVKKRSDSRLAVDLGNNVQDAFVIAVEQQARDRLQRLSALKRIKPVDMGLLSIQLNQQSSDKKQDLSFLSSASPIYVTSLNGTDKSGISASINSPAQPNPTSSGLSNGHGPLRDLQNIQESPRLVSVLDSGKHSVSELVDSGGRIKPGGKEVLLGEQIRTTAIVENTLSGEPNRPRRRSGSSIVVLGADEKPRLPVDDFPQDGHTLQRDLDMVMKLSLSQADTGPHREMAVDVPESFIARNKTPPRYPPPKPPQMNGSITPGANHVGSSSEVLAVDPGVTKPVPPPRDHLRIEKDGRLVNRAPAPQVPARTNNNHLVTPALPSAGQDPTPDQLDSIRKFQEQLRKRREDEERIAQQNEFLRASLRGSRKLQALQDSGLPPQGQINDAYDDDDLVNADRQISGYGDLVAALQRLQSQLQRHGVGALAGRVATVQSLLLGSAVASALSTRNVVLERRKLLVPINNHAQGLVKDCVDGLAQSNSPAAIELCDILSSYEMEGLIHAHDRTAASIDRSEQMSLGSTQIADDHIKIIQIEKTNEPLGATIRNEGEAVIVGRVVRGGAAEKTRLLHEGDEILEVNGIEMRGKSVNDVCALLSSMAGTLTFLVVPAGSPPPGGGHRDPVVLHVRAHFDYDPEDDLYIPCRELGISFQKGDVLHVISREDPNWWQAFREGEEDQTLAGLVPSQAFQHQRESMKQSITAGAGIGSGHDRGRKGATLLCAKKAAKRKKRGKPSSEAGYPLYATNTTDDNEPEEILTYEEVALYYPRANHKRPVVLIGPPNIGRHELRQRLMGDSERFAAAIPHTSRGRRDGEVPGQDYHFITRAQFEADILARRFVEHGEYEKAYYGTSLDAIRSVVSSGKICVLNLHPQSLKLLRASDLKPYTVLVAPPSLEKLRQKRLRSGEPYKEEELKEIIATAREMEARWGHLFDMIIINNDTERAYHQLLSEINSLEREPQWVPAMWLH